MPKNHLQTLRLKAFERQEHRCYYCGFLMWEEEPVSFALKHKITVQQAQRFRSTAEHLIARQDGGKDMAENIVSACLFCNQTRHRLKPAPEPEMHKKGIIKQLVHHGWHPKKIAANPTIRAR